MRLTHYEILGVDRNVDIDGLKEAKKRKVLEVHPDKNLDKDTSAQFRLVLKAYQVLSDPQERDNYDRDLSNLLKVQNSPAADPSLFKHTKPEDKSAKPKDPEKKTPGPSIFEQYKPKVGINDEYDFFYKFVFIGSSLNSMKTNLIKAIVNNPFQSETRLGVGFETKTLKIEKIGIVKIHLWDTFAKEQFRQINQIFYSSAAATVVVVDAANETTLENAKSQLTSLKKNGQLYNMIISFVMVNSNPALKKSDLEHLDEYFEGFPISQKIEVNLEKPNPAELECFLSELVKLVYNEEYKLPTEPLIGGLTKKDESKEGLGDNTNCLVM